MSFSARKRKPASRTRCKTAPVFPARTASGLMIPKVRLPACSAINFLSGLCGLKKTSGRRARSERVLDRLPDVGGRVDDADARLLQSLHLLGGRPLPAGDDGA